MCAAELRSDVAAVVAFARRERERRRDGSASTITVKQVGGMDGIGTTWTALAASPGVDPSASPSVRCGGGGAAAMGLPMEARVVVGGGRERVGLDGAVWEWDGGDGLVRHGCGRGGGAVAWRVVGEESHFGAGAAADDEVVVWWVEVEAEGKRGRRRALSQAEAAAESCGAGLDEAMEVLSGEARTQVPLARVLAGVAELVAGESVVARGDEGAYGARMLALAEEEAGAEGWDAALRAALLSVILGTAHDRVIGALRLAYADDDADLAVAMRASAPVLDVVAHLDARPALAGIQLGGAEARIDALHDARTPAELAAAASAVVAALNAAVAAHTPDAPPSMDDAFPLLVATIVRAPLSRPASLHAYIVALGPTLAAATTDHGRWLLATLEAALAYVIAPRPKP